MAASGLEVDVPDTEDTDTSLSKGVANDGAKAGLREKLESSSNYSMNSVVSCRICKNSSGTDLVPSPCHCKGSMGTVHKSCLEEWLTGSIRDSCELCSFPFKVVRTRKYTLTQSIWYYICHYVNFIRFFRDLFFLSVSLMNTIVLMYMWVSYVMGLFLGHSGASAKQRELDQVLADSPVRAVLYFVFFTLCLMFVSVNAVDDVRRLFYFYFLPWYQWWQTNVDVKLLLEDTDVELKEEQISTNNP